MGFVRSVASFKLFKILFVVTLIAFVFSGCNQKDIRTVIKFSTWGSASELKILNPIIAEFEKENPDIKIELLHIPQDYFQKLHLLFASNLAPDVIFINNLNLPRYKNQLYDLTADTDRTLYFKQSIDGLSVDGKLYAVPRDVSTLVIYYNKSLFRKYGIPYPDKNWSIEDLISKSKVFEKNNVWGINYEPEMYYCLPYIHYMNGEIITKNGEYKGNSPETQTGIKLYKDLVYRYKIAPTAAQKGSRTSAQMFLEGVLAMHLSGRWMCPKYRQSANFDWDIVNFPHSCAYCDASGWAVSKNSKNKKEAVKFIQFLSSRKNIIKMAQDGLIVPARIDVAYSDNFLNGSPKSSKLFLYAVETTKATVVTKDYAKLLDILNNKVFQSASE